MPYTFNVSAMNCKCLKIRLIRHLASEGIMRHPHVNGIAVSQELHTIWKRKLYYLLQNPVLPIRESCTTYYRKLYYLLENPVLPITESCNTYYRKL